MDSLPSCALECFAQAVNKSTCAQGDIGCYCQDTQISVHLQPCFTAECRLRNLLTATRFFYTECHYPTSNNIHIFPDITTFGLVIAIVSVGLRVAGRMLRQNMGMDDYTILLALAVTIAISGVAYPMVNSGLGQDIFMIPFDNISRTLQLFLVEQILYVAAIALSKCSMLFLYLRLFPSIYFRYATIALLALTVFWGVIFIFLLIFSCSPVSYYYHQWDGEHTGHCSIDNNRIFLAYSIINIILDIVIVGLPMPTVWKLHVSVGKRIGLCLMFAVGLLVTTISLVRLSVTVNYNNTNNPIRDFVMPAVWSILEVDLGIMCCCMPGIRRCVKHFLAVVTGKTETSYGYTTRQQSSGGISNSQRNRGRRHMRQSIELEDMELQAYAAAPARGYLVEQKAGLSSVELDNYPSDG